MLNRLEKKFGNYAIQNLSMYLVMAMAIVTGVVYLNLLPGLAYFRHGSFNNPMLNVLCYPFLLHGSLISIAFQLYIIFFFGNNIEQVMGHFRFTVFVLVGLILIPIGAMIIPYPVSYIILFQGVLDQGMAIHTLDTTFLLAIGYLIPDMTIQLFFILPIRMKVLARFFLALIVVNLVMQLVVVRNFFPLLMLPFGFGNFLLLFGQDLYRSLIQKGRSAEYKRKAQSLSLAFRHKCEVCGLTELDDPQMDFRYCVGCDEKEYCSLHLHDHKHS